MAEQIGVDTAEVERQVKEMYSGVARQPDAGYHFELGRPLAERLGYPKHMLDRIPEQAVESFAGVGFHFDLAALQPSEKVLDLGSGSGTDVFMAGLDVGPSGSVTGVDMTDDQVAKAAALRLASRMRQVRFVHGHIEEIAFEDESFDTVISNGVINLVADKAALFAQIARVLRPGGRMAISDIVSEQTIAARTAAKPELWAACVAGAAQHEDYQATIEQAGLEVNVWRENPEYRFVSDRARTTSVKYGVYSVSLLAVKPA